MSCVGGATSRTACEPLNYNHLFSFRSDPHQRASERACIESWSRCWAASSISWSLGTVWAERLGILGWDFGMGFWSFGMHGMGGNVHA